MKPVTRTFLLAAPTILYRDNFIWGGKVYLDANKTMRAARQPIRVGGGAYSMHASLEGSLALAQRQPLLTRTGQMCATTGFVVSTLE